MRSSSLLLMALAEAPVQATSLGDLAMLLGDRGASAFSAWDALHAMSGVCWRDPEVAGAAYVRHGAAMLVGLGPATIVVTGTRQTMRAVEVSIPFAIDARPLAHTLKAQFPAGARLESVRERGRAGRVTGAGRVYRVARADKQPIYVRVVSTPDGRTDRPGTVFALVRDDKAESTG